jgi:adenylosuccinate lyase
MIARYTRPAMGRVWSETRRLERWLEVELAVTAAREKRGTVPAGTTVRLRERARIDAERMAAIEAEVGHDVIAFLSMLAESVGDDARHVHAGLTSSDVVDSALALQIVEAGRLLEAGLSALRAAARMLAERHRHTVMAGRTHGVHAEPITFGLKCLVWSEELTRGGARLAAALDDCAVGKLSGAVGTLAHLEPAIEVEALAALGLRPEPVANQVVQRDRHAALMSSIAVLGGTLEKIALEIRHLQRSEVGEVEEPFRERQKGSSAMPHKRNPIRCERVCGLARLLRAYALTACENQALWHERDISHSSAERVILPDGFVVADFMLAELTAVLEGLKVHPERMRKNLNAGGGVMF